MTEETLVRLHADGINDDSRYFQARIDGRIIGRTDGKPDDGSPGDYRVALRAPGQGTVKSIEE